MKKLENILPLRDKNNESDENNFKGNIKTKKNQIGEGNENKKIFFFFCVFVNV
jgi:hypothetical protein